MTAYIGKIIHRRRVAIILGLLWVLFILGFTYNESLLPFLWKDDYNMGSQLISNLAKDSYLLANIGIVVIVVLEVWFENIIFNHNVKLVGEMGNKTKHIDGSFILFAFFSIVFAFLLYVYCRNNTDYNTPLLYTYLIGWLLILTYLKFVVFHNPIVIPTKEIFKGSTIIKL